MELFLDTNFAFFPRGSPAKSTCIANVDDATIVVDLTETTDPLSPRRQDEFHSVSTEGNQDPNMHHIQSPSTAVGDETHSTDKGKSTPPASEKGSPLVQDKSSTSSLDPEEILSLKQQNPTETLKRLQKLCQV